MKKLTSTVILQIVFVLALGSIAIAAPNIAGTWKGTVLKVSPTACTNLQVTVNLVQCSTSSGLVRGTWTMGDYSVPFVGKFIADTKVFQFHGEKFIGEYDTISFTAYGKYVTGTPAKIQIFDLDLLTLIIDANYNVVGSNDLYGTFNLNKQ